MNENCLRGIAWNHSRALPPLVATAQRYEESHPGVRIVWEKRTLHEFGHASLAQLADHYDLLVIDHPMMGEAADGLIDLKLALRQTELQELSGTYAGPSLESYEYEGALYALPIDAAAPAASYRPDLLLRLGLTVPATWSELLELARLGKVRMPGFPADLFLNWMGLCVSRGHVCANSPEYIFDRDTALASLEDLRALASQMPPSIYCLNPIALYEAMAAGDDFVYCPFAYSYSNYSRRGFAEHLLQFGNPVRLSEGSPIRTILGGTGIAISKRCAAVHHALAYSRFVANPAVQRDIYGPSGGQPAARAAWDDAFLNSLSRNFFSDTRESIDSAYVRPRYPGYIPLQEQAGIHIASHLQGKIGAGEALVAIDQLYRDSRQTASAFRRAQEVQHHA